MAVNTYMSFRISEPRALQLEGVAKRWYPLLLKVLKSDKDTLKIQPIRANYRLKMTEVPYQGSRGTQKLQISEPA